METLVEPDLRKVSALDLLSFEDNAYRKRHVDAHDQVISVLHETQQDAASEDEAAHDLNKLNTLKKKRQRPTSDIE